jgi:hypothetical protein
MLWGGQTALTAGIASIHNLIGPIFASSLGAGFELQLAWKPLHIRKSEKDCREFRDFSRVS